MTTPTINYRLTQLITERESYWNKIRTLERRLKYWVVKAEGHTREIKKLQ